MTQEIRWRKVLKRHSVKRLKLRRGAPCEQLLGQIKDNVNKERVCHIGAMEIRYMIFPWSGEDDPMGGYDEEGTIFGSDNVVRAHPGDADLTAFREQLEINHKLAGRSHAYAHRKALQDELTTAKQLFTQPGQLRDCLRRRLKPYPGWKVKDKPDVET